MGSGGALKHYTAISPSLPRHLKAYLQTVRGLFCLRLTGEGSKTLLLKEGKAGRKKSVRSQFGDVLLFAVKNFKPESISVALTRRAYCNQNVCSTAPNSESAPIRYSQKLGLLRDAIQMMLTFWVPEGVHSSQPGKCQSLTSRAACASISTSKLRGVRCSLTQGLCHPQYYVI